MAGNNIRGLLALAGCTLLLFTGCGAADTAQTETKDTDTGYITVAQAKAAALENAGVSEEHVKFVRVQLNTGEDASRYEMEFVSADAEYSYIVNAVTGELISMSSENAAYNLAAIPTEVTQAADAQENALQNGSAQGAEAPGGSAGAQSGAEPAPDGQYVGVEAAKQAALDHAGMKEGAVRFTHAHLELDDGRWVYDVVFHKSDTEYEYSIDALTGAVLSYDHDAEYFQAGADGNRRSNAPKEAITSEEAARIALEHAGVDPADAQQLKAGFDYDDGRAEYEIEWRVGEAEYACDVDAHTGAVLSFEKEFD